MSLVLGTAQLGFDYGIANKTGKIDDVSGLQLIQWAVDNGINTFDTAQSYGDAEIRLGSILQLLGKNSTSKVITKLSDPNTLSSEHKLLGALEASAKRLHQSSIYCVHLHHEQWLEKLDEGLLNWLRKAKKIGLIRRIGVSLYSTEYLERVLANGEFDLVQIPANVLDKRFQHFFTHQPEENKTRLEVHIRSVFLQGLLLMAAQEIPNHLRSAVEVIETFHNLCKAHSISPLFACVGYIKQVFPSFHLVVGAENWRQLEEIKRAFDLDIDPDFYSELQELECTNPNIILPQNWKKLT